jgi:type I restriction enzyme S subunit
VPEHWGVKKFKYLFQIKKRIAGKLGYDVLSITQKGIKVKDIESGEGQLSSDYSKYQYVRVGDYAMNHMDLLTGFVDLSKYNGVTSPDYRVFSLVHSASNAQYYLYLLQMGYLNKLFYPFGQGASHLGRWRLPTEAFNEFLAPCPPQQEQEEIAKFIQGSLNKFDTLTKKARQAIALLKERRTALISAAVTGKIKVTDEVREDALGCDVREEV